MKRFKDWLNTPNVKGWILLGLFALCLGALVGKC